MLITSKTENPNIDSLSGLSRQPGGLLFSVLVRSFGPVANSDDNVKQSVKSEKYIWLFTL